MLGPFTAASHHDVLVLLIQVAVLLFTARAFGEIAGRLGQPSVVGEILAGIVLGPSLLSGLFPAIGAWIVPAPGVPGYLLEVVSLLGALFLLLITGLETDLALIRRHARTAFGVSLGGIVVTFSSGFLLGQLLPDFLLGSHNDRLVFALFVATAMSISAIPVIAKVLMDLNLMRRDIGQTIIAAGMSDDTIGWVLLSIVAGLAAEGAVTAGSVFSAVGSVAAFMILSFTVGRWVAKRALDFVQDEVRSDDRLVTLVVVLTLAWGALTQALNLEAVLGAFIMGILLGQLPRLPEAVHQKLITVSLAIFTPIFFATAGLKVNIVALLDPRILAITAGVIAIATGGKVVGTYIGARVIGRRDHWTALAFGAGLNARGAMEIIIATIGLQLGILGTEMFSIIVIMAMATSLMAPPALRWALARVTPEQQELDRLRKEELTAESTVAKIHRVLVPVRRRPPNAPIQAMEAHVIERFSRGRPMAVTLLNITEPEGKDESNAFLDRLAPHFSGAETTRKIVESRDPAREILAESRKDYDLLILGATEQRREERVLFHPMVDELIRMSACPTLVVKGSSGDTLWPPRRILVPTNGSLGARRAGEFALTLARESEEVVILNVVQSERGPYRRGTRPRFEKELIDTGWGFVRQLTELGDAEGVRTVGEVRQGPNAEDVILDLARDEGIDLIVLGTDVRPGSERLFLGPRVERVLGGAPCPVLILNGL